MVKRPGLGSKPRKSSSLRMSFGPSETGDDGAGVFTPKKSALSRMAAERNAERAAALRPDIARVERRQLDRDPRP
ncbi:MAG: hypothetical protein INR71_11300, partial [Terriglobus roseus]|nr:hypothetical protein [Terriglobus roseus]